MARTQQRRKGSAMQAAATISAVLFLASGVACQDVLVQGGATRPFAPLPSPPTAKISAPAPLPEPIFVPVVPVRTPLEPQPVPVPPVAASPPPFVAPQIVSSPPPVLPAPVVEPVAASPPPPFVAPKVAASPPPAPVAPPKLIAPPPRVIPSPPPVPLLPPPAPKIVLPPPAPKVVLPPPAPKVVLPPPAPKVVPSPPPAPVPSPEPVPVPAPSPEPAAVPAPQPEPAAAAPAAAAPARNATGGFIRVVNTKFVDANCNNFIPIGWNAWHLIESITGSAAAPVAGVVPNGESFIDYTLRTGRAAGFNTFRFFPFGDNDDNRQDPNRQQFALQRAPGVYNETIFKAIDALLARAAVNNLKVIMAFADNWKVTDSLLQYLEWCTDQTPPSNSSIVVADTSAFYSNPRCRQLYQSHIRKVVNRVNTVNGVIYKNDPTIFAWDLMNEPRCSNNCGDALQSWISVTSQFLKSIDPNHLVTVGEEGFFGASSPFKQSNPAASSGATWPQQAGQDFVSNHAAATIDFAAIHLWPDRWEETDPSFAATWLSGHVQAATGLRKPLLLEEFGKLVPRDPFYQAAMTRVTQAAVRNEILQGALFWLFQSYSDGNDATRVEYGVVPADNAWSIMSRAADTLANRTASRVAGCTIGGSAPQPQSTEGNVAIAG